MRSIVERELVLWSAAWGADPRVRKLTALVALFVAWLCGGVAEAAGGGGLPFDDAADDLTSSFTGPLAKVAGVGGVVATGSAWLRGASMDNVVGRGVGTVAGVALLGGANSLYDNYSESGALLP